MRAWTSAVIAALVAMCATLATAGAQDLPRRLLDCRSEQAARQLLSGLSLRDLVLLGDQLALLMRGREDLNHVPYVFVPIVAAMAQKSKDASAVEQLVDVVVNRRHALEWRTVVAGFSRQLMPAGEQSRDALRRALLGVVETSAEDAGLRATCLKTLVAWLDDEFMELTRASDSYRAVQRRLGSNEAIDVIWTAVDWAAPQRQVLEGISSRAHSLAGICREIIIAPDSADALKRESLASLGTFHARNLGRRYTEQVLFQLLSGDDHMSELLRLEFAATLRQATEAACREAVVKLLATTKDAETLRQCELRLRDWFPARWNRREAELRRTSPASQPRRTR